MKAQVAIVGGGPAGSAASMYLNARGIQSIIVEKVSFPRYHIGESLTAEAGGLLRGLGFEERMLANRYPIKHGVKVLGEHPWWVPAMQRLPDGTLTEQFTWQVRRSDFDKMLLDEAVSRGATLVPGKATKPLVADDGTVCGLAVRTEDGGDLEIDAEVVLDCSGQATFLATHGVTGEKYLGAYDKQIAVFSQVVGFERDTGGGTDRDSMPGNTIIFYKGKYHWSWAIPLDDDVTSIGVVIPAQYFLDRGETKEDFYRRELRELHKELARRLPEPELVEDVHVIPNYSYQVRRFAGKGFLCVGDAHRFIDPIFSFGAFVTMKEAGFAAERVQRYLEGEDRDSEQLFRDHILRCEQATDILEDLIDSFWENPLAFAVFVHSRYRDACIDTFSGRIYVEESVPSDFPRLMRAFRKLLDRTRAYDDEDDSFSIPIGSRFKPERAPLWNSVLDSVETTEHWMRSN